MLLFVVTIALFVIPGCDLVKEASGGLRFCECTDNPLQAEHNCNVSKLNCNNNVREWCRAQKDKPENQCVDEGLRRCEESRTKCMEAIKPACPAGKMCKDCLCK